MMSESMEMGAPLLRVVLPGDPEIALAFYGRREGLDGAPASLEFTARPILDGEEAERVLEGWIKFDGCVHLRSEHLCGTVESRQAARVLNALHEHAAKILGPCCS